MITVSEYGVIIKVGISGNRLYVNRVLRFLRMFLNHEIIVISSYLEEIEVPIIDVNILLDYYISQ